ncbi:hypothetical protein NMG60_11020638 [Bertholletia excelsa]
MYKNQLQELAQRSCFNLPSYSCIREGPDHAPRFKSTVNFNGETFESPTFCSTLRQAEHAAAEVALNTLANRGPSKALAARVLDETGVYKNLLQETAHRAGINLPVYTTVRSGPGHVPVFSCRVELAGMSFSGEPAKTKKQAQKNAAMAAWTALKQLAGSKTSSSTSHSCSSSEVDGSEEQEQVVIARVLASLQPAESNNSARNNHQRPIPTHGSHIHGAPSLHPMPYENWAYSNLTAELAMYQMWQQAHLLHLQSRLMTLPILPAPPGPQVLQHVTPVFPPNHHLHFSAKEQGSIALGLGGVVTALSPSLREENPNPAGPEANIAALSPSFYVHGKSSTRGRSMVTIQEIEEKNEEPSNLCMGEVHKASLNSNPEKLVQEPGQEDQQKNGVSEAKIGHTEQFQWLPQSSHPGFQPVKFPVQTQYSFDSYPSNLRPQHLPRASSHRTPQAPSPVSTAGIRIMGHPSSVGPRPQNSQNLIHLPPKMRTGGVPNSTRSIMGCGRVPSHFMAPAVQIRSVTPVCSSPPVKKMVNTKQDGESSNQVKSIGLEDVSAASSELSKLQI